MFGRIRSWRASCLLVLVPPREPRPHEAAHPGSATRAKKLRTAMSRTRDRLRPRGESDHNGPHRHRGEHHGQVPAAQALPRRSRRGQRRAHGPVDAGGDLGARAVHERLRGPTGEERRVRRWSGARPRGDVGAVRRRGAPAGHRRSLRRDQGPHRRLDGDRRRQPRARRRTGRGTVGRPGAGGKPIHEWLEVRPFLAAKPSITECTFK